ncbi:MAG: chemotaxis protein CheW [Planctomycetota bacterium]|jgi:purine-binding chemotaxis protein CheW
MAELKEKVSLANKLDDQEMEDGMKNKFLAFRVGDENYGIEIRHVKEIVVVHKITEVPDMEEYVRGVINLRGQVIPVIDVRLRFLLVPREYDDRTCIVVVNVNDNVVGMIVDSVTEVVDIPEDRIDPPPAVSRSPASRFVLGVGHVGDGVRILLDADKVLRDEGTKKEEVEAEIPA